MSTLDRSERMLDDLLSDARSTIEQTITDEVATIEPDFAAIVEELRERDLSPSSSSSSSSSNSSADSSSWRAHAESYTELAESSRARGSLDELDDPLAALIQDTRQEIEADVAARRLLPLPPLAASSAAENDETPAPASAAIGPRLRWLTAALTIAAAVALLWGFGPSLARPLLGDTTASQAQWTERETGESGRANARGATDEEPGKLRRTRRPSAGASVSSDSLPGSDALEDVDSLDALEENAELETSELPQTPDDASEPVDSAKTVADKTVADKTVADKTVEPIRHNKPINPNNPSEHPATPRIATTPASSDAPSTADLNTLEANAEALWRAGDRVGAEALLRTIIRRSRSRRRADLAYGDLFTITRQLYGREREAAVWREYLERFPRGRYADDARAGLCRRQGQGHSGADGCWSDYLRDFPGGTHRQEADRASQAATP